MFVLMKSWTSSKMGHVGSNTRSLGHIIEKPCVSSRGHIFSPVIIKLGQHVCLEEKPCVRSKATQSDNHET